jgi:hypothetical protein
MKPACGCVTVFCVQELRMRRVAQEHIDAALTAVFGDSKQIAGREASDEAQEGKHLQLLFSPAAAVATRGAYQLASILAKFLLQLAWCAQP